MRKRKWTGLVLILTLLLGIMSGCSPVEKDYFNLASEMSGLKAFQQSGSIELSIAQMPDDFYDENVTREKVQEVLEKYRIDFVAAVDYEKNILNYDFAIVDKNTGEKIAAVSALYKNNTYYIKVDEMVAFLKQFAGDEEKQEIDKLWAGVEYISLSSQDFQQIVADDSEAGDQDIFAAAAKRQQISLNLMESLINNVYDNFESNLISQNNNQYILTLRGDCLIDNLKPFIVYSINNIDKLGATLSGFVNGLSPSDMETLGLTGVTKEEIQEDIAEMVLDVTHNRAEYLAEFESESVQADEELRELFGDSVLTCTYEKVDARNYKSSLKLRLNITDEGMQEMDLTLSLNSNIKAGSFKEPSIPTGNIISFEKLQERLPKILYVYVDDQWYYVEQGLNFDSGDIDVKIIDNQVYLPMRTVVELMGDQVGWDDAAKQAYVERDGQRIVLNGRVIDGVSYVNKTELEKLGYIISWDDWDRSVMIEKE